MRQYESIEDVFTVFKNQHLLEKKKGFYQSMLMWQQNGCLRVVKNVNKILGQRYIFYFSFKGIIKNCK